MTLKLYHMLTGACLALAALPCVAQTIPGTINTITHSTTIAYTGTAPQTLPPATVFASSTLSHDVYNLVIDNPAGVTYGSGSYLNVLDTLFLTAGTLNTTGSLYLYGPISTGAGQVRSGGNLVGFLGTGAAQTIPGSAFGGDSIGTLAIHNNWGVSSAGPLTVPGSLALEEGTFSLGGNLTIGGTISYSAGGITPGSDTITFSGTVAQAVPSGTFTGSTVENIVIANAAGVTFDGSIINTGSLALPLLGTTPPLLAPGQAATIGGVLRVSGFSVSVSSGQTFTIDSAGSLDGTYASLSLPSGYSGTMSYTATTARLTITGALTSFAVASFMPPDSITSLQVYPNPVIDNFTIRSKTAIQKIVVCDERGNVVRMAGNINLTQYTLPMVGVAPGAYFVTITGNGLQQTKTIIKQ